MNEPRDIMAAYFEGTLDAEQVAELETWLREDGERTRAFVRQAMLDSHLGELLREQNLQDVAVDLSNESQFGAMLKALDAPEGETELVNLTKLANQERNARKAIQTEQRRAARQDTLRSLKFLITPKLIAYTSVAAMLILTVTLLAVFAFGPSPTAPETALLPPATIQPPAQPIVATLTAQHNAVWALQPSEDLRPGNRLTLTAGFAEITTNRGAIAIVEAPATIELLNNDNAIRLHTGKLVGICETESSKGFLVRTPHMDITDLGTRFGVDASSADATEVQVYEGEVEISHLAMDGSGSVVRDHLIAGQAMRAEAATGALARIEVPSWGPVLLPRLLPDRMTPYEDAVSDLNPIAWWRHEPASPQAAVFGEVAFQSDDNSPALNSIRFDGQGCLDAGDVLGFEADDAFSISCWIKPGINDRAFIIGRMGHSAKRGLHGYDLYLFKGRLLFQLKNGFGQSTDPLQMLCVASADAIQRSQWQHVVATYDGSRRAAGVHIYIDGVPVDTSAKDDTLGDASIRTTAPFRLGVRGFAVPDPAGPSTLGDTKGSAMVGDMGEALVFDHALKPAEIKTIYELSRGSYSR